MKVICKTNISRIPSSLGVTSVGVIYDLTIGKVYEVYTFNNGLGTHKWSYVIDDHGAKEPYHEYMHTTLVELRNEKIEEILK